MIPPFTLEQQAQAQAIIDDACECDPAFAAAWYAECAKQTSYPAQPAVAPRNTGKAAAGVPPMPAAAPLSPTPAMPGPMRASHRGVGK